MEAALPLRAAGPRRRQAQVFARLPLQQRMRLARWSQKNGRWRIVAVAATAMTLLAGVPRAVAAETWPLILDDSGANGNRWHEVDNSTDDDIASACLKDAHLDTLHYDGAEIKGAVRAVYSFQPTSTACYLIDEWHPGANPNCSRHLPRAVRIEIGFGNGNRTYAFVDQSIKAGRWNPVVMLGFKAGLEATIVSYNHGTGDNCASSRCIWVADAFRLTKLVGRTADCRDLADGPGLAAHLQATPAPTFVAPPPWDSTIAQQQQGSQYSPPISTTIDDRDASVRNQGGALHSLACDSTAYLGSAYAIVGGVASAHFMFVPSSSGCYRLDEFHPESSVDSDHGCHLRQPMRVEVESASADAQATVELRGRGGRWNVAGHFPLSKGVTAGVKASRDDSWEVGKLWVVDAFRFTRIATSCQDRPHSILITLRVVGVRLSSSAVHGKPVEPLGLRLSLTSAIADSAKTDLKAVHILGVRHGSVIIDLELRGATAEITAAARRMQSDLASGRAGGLATALCSALGASPVSGSCHVEADRFVDDLERHDASQALSTELMIGISCAGVLLLLCILLQVAALWDWRRRGGKGRKAVWSCCLRCCSWFCRLGFCDRCGRRRAKAPVDDARLELQAAAAEADDDDDEAVKKLADPDGTWTIPVDPVLAIQDRECSRVSTDTDKYDETWKPPHALEWDPPPPFETPAASSSAGGDATWMPLHKDFLRYARELHARQERPDDISVSSDPKVPKVETSPTGTTEASTSTAPPSRESREAAGEARASAAEPEVDRDAEQREVAPQSSTEASACQEDGKEDVEDHGDGRSSSDDDEDQDGRKPKTMFINGEELEFESVNSI